VPGLTTVNKGYNLLAGATKEVKANSAINVKTVFEI
jgi:hypothetical protein